MRQNMIRNILLAIIAVLPTLASCDTYQFDDEYDLYYVYSSRVSGYLSHYISTNGNGTYVRTYNCPIVTYSGYDRLYYCWDGNRLILCSGRPITVHHTHNSPGPVYHMYNSPRPVYHMHHRHHRPKYEYHKHYKPKPSHNSHNSSRPSHNRPDKPRPTHNNSRHPHNGSRPSRINR